MNATETKPTPKNQPQYINAVAKGLEVIASGGSKADAARAIYEILLDEERDVLIQAFIEGATVTQKGSPTYFYNVKRQFERKQREEGKKPATKKKTPLNPV
ncbi:hypothetical protein GALL_379920 [mine drainage metagenome]|uniref:Uncharacterized protein n=1 Tax=mine drainage metagenome TaxID=410659 RepID=A0A1J5QJZ7_9ZZZZ